MSQKWSFQPLPRNIHWDILTNGDVTVFCRPYGDDRAKLLDALNREPETYGSKDEAIEWLNNTIKSMNAKLMSAEIKIREQHNTICELQSKRQDADTGTHLNREPETCCSKDERLSEKTHEISKLKAHQGTLAGHIRIQSEAIATLQGQLDAAETEIHVKQETIDDLTREILNKQCARMALEPCHDQRIRIADLEQELRAKAANETHWFKKHQDLEAAVHRLCQESKK